MPYAGCRYSLNIDGVGSYGDYLSSIISVDYPNCVWIVSFGASGANLTYDSAERFYGQSIRPVYSVIDPQER